MVQAEKKAAEAEGFSSCFGGAANIQCWWFAGQILIFNV